MIIEQILGAALMLLLLADIFLTVLYARAGTGLLAPRWNRAIWALLHAVAKLFGKRRSTVLSLAGPLIVVSLIGFWAIGLTVGAALVIQPELGTTIRPSSGDTPTDFVTSLLVAGNSLSIVGGGDYSPHTTGTRLLFLLNSLIGASVLSLVLSYLVQVYSGLRERNALALAVDLMTDGTGDAAVMLTRLMPDGEASEATSELGNLIRSLAATKEAHHFYPLLFYFRFEEPLYAVSRFTFVLLDATTLIDTALDRDRYGTLAASAPVAAIRRGARMLLETLDANFPTAGDRANDAAEAWGLRQSYLSATRTLESAGVAARTDGVEAYVAAREEWEPLVRRVAPTLGYTMSEIDRRSTAMQTAGGN
ncbi:potassium channel family protein [Sphingomonas psychrotolerans]|uniref:Potassium channel family protein n=1 Tax=Sphingomonas psychrotolerans TaxID=1327635 RepID=A0ABU3MZN7_9SPHN|nr:ion channel [Sphingomonas psychrotolerans]MDT8757759.1 potassium channel family protein [Sphingomonas psychrotolerans]